MCTPNNNNSFSNDELNEFTPKEHENTVETSKNDIKGQKSANKCMKYQLDLNSENNSGKDLIVSNIDKKYKLPVLYANVIYFFERQLWRLKSEEGFGSNVKCNNCASWRYCNSYNKGAECSVGCYTEEGESEERFLEFVCMELRDMFINVEKYGLSNKIHRYIEFDLFSF